MTTAYLVDEEHMDIKDSTNLTQAKSSTQLDEPRAFSTAHQADAGAESRRGPKQQVDRRKPLPPPPPPTTPALPPKGFSPESLSHVRQPFSSVPKAAEKPLPTPPGPALHHSSHEDIKPLQRLPSSRVQSPSRAHVDLRRTSLWIVGFAVWFLATVLMLPVVLEGDAMPRLNRYMWSLFPQGLGQDS